MDVRFSTGSLFVAAALTALTACAGRAYYAPGYAQAGVRGLGEPTLVGRTILVGDAGLWGRQEVTPGRSHATLPGLVAADVALKPDLTTVVYLGDNVYEYGLPPTDEDDAPDGCVPRDNAERGAGEAALQAQINAAATSRATIFVPGNHDWRAKGDCAVARRNAEAKFIGEHSSSRAELAPSEPCPGPKSFDVPGFRLITFDSEWLLRESDELAAQCGGQSRGLPDRPSYEEVVVAFWSAMARDIHGAAGRTVILLSHHPVRSHGEHGGRLHLKHLFLDFLRPLFLKQDLKHPRYKRLIAGMDVLVNRALEQDQKLTIIHAAGHEHNLEVIGHPRSTRALYLVSGAASKSTRHGSGEDTQFSATALGYMVLDLVQTDFGERLFLEVVGPDSEGDRRTHYAAWIADRVGGQ